MQRQAAEFIQAVGSFERSLEGLGVFGFRGVRFRVLEFRGFRVRVRGIRFWSLGF